MKRASFGVAGARWESIRLKPLICGYNRRMAIDLRELFEAAKTLTTNPRWVDTDSTWFNLGCPIDVDQVTVEGLELRGGAGQTLPDRAVRFQLQLHPARARCIPLCRIEWRPISPHTNPNSGPEHLRLLRIDGSHIHGFEINFLEADSRMRRRNLPIAEPLNPDPQSFDDLLDVVAKAFRISGMEKIEAPPWREADLFGI